VSCPEDPLADSWDQVKAWRRGKRLELIEHRRAKSAAERNHTSEAVLKHLLESIDAGASPTLGLYWPIRGELDLRPLARRHVAAGGTVALPVVVRAAAPVEFWRWEPGVRMVRGLWNIPVPKERRPVTPDVLVIPLVGFDRARYRLGYGGGFYDRTLAAATPRPHTIGVGFADAELPTIYPQGHDIALDRIVTA
jgi:5-formyltetrahydrofolate cyclo-ligase